MADDGFWAAFWTAFWQVLGASIAGGVGVFLFYLQGRRDINQRVLGPVYNFVDTYIEDPWEVTRSALSHDFPWRSVGMDRIQVRAGISKKLDALRKAFEGMNPAEHLFLNVYEKQPTDELRAKLQRIIADYWKAGDPGYPEGYLDLGPLGWNPGARSSIGELFRGAYQHILRHSQDPRAAWTEAARRKWNRERGFNLLIEAAWRYRPKMLEDFHRTVLDDASAAEGKDPFRVFDERRKDVLKKARAVRAAVFRRLHPILWLTGRGP